MVKTLGVSLPPSAFFALLRVKIQPGTIPGLVLFGLGLADWTLIRRNDRRKTRRVLWDMFDPQGHHSIQE